MNIVERILKGILDIFIVVTISVVIVTVFGGTFFLSIYLAYKMGWADWTGLGIWFIVIILILGAFLGLTEDNV
jgi:hypothetical protein